MKPHNLSNDYLNIFARIQSKSLRSRRVLPRYLDWLFSHVPLNDALVYDIGGGNGLISFYAAEQGAREVICVEPLGDGSRSNMLTNFHDATKVTCNGDRVKLETLDLVNFAKGCSEKADIVVLHNVVNHLDEDACRRLGSNDTAARRNFIAIFELIYGLTRNGGIVIVADAGRDSFWTEIGVYNPFAPSIDRKVHQQPEVWRDLMLEAGFSDPSIRWTPFVRLMMGLGHLDRVLGPRSLSAYYSLGHFVLTMRRLD